jgi:hypothetical protein
MPDRDGDALTLTTTLHNTGAGHAIPTGEPLRHIIVAVSASCDGTRRPQILGPTVSGLGGAWGSGRVGTEIQVVADPEGCASCLLLWPGLPAELPAPETLAVRAIRPSGAFLDYDGPLDFASGGRFSVEEKGLPENSPIAEVSLVEAGPGWVRIAEPLPVVEGDVLFVSSAALPPGGGSPEPLAGFPGMDLARVLADAEGRQAVPHHRAVDVIRDNRVPAGGSASWELGWDVAGCETVDVIGRVYYRRFPWALARERGWNGVDTVFSEQSIQVGP